MQNFETRLAVLRQEHETLIALKNEPVLPGNGIFERFKNPVITASHIPLEWRYDLNPKTNPFLMERMGVNAAFNAGAIKFDGKYTLVVRVEGSDRKSFFALAQSSNGVDTFKFVGLPLLLDQNEEADVNVYDMRLTQHEDGWIYGLFCTERKDPHAPFGDTSMATAACGIVRTKDLQHWERLPDLVTKSPQQRNVLLHPEFVNGKYLLFTRPQDGFIQTGNGGGICAGYCDDMTHASIDEEKLVDEKIYHTIKEVKNGAGAVPIKTKEGWLFIAHGVRNTACGLRYVVYAFMTSLEDPTKVIYKPSGYLIAPEGQERVGDVSNVVFVNGAIVDDDGRVLIYYASSDTRLHVAQSSIERLVDYCKNTPEDTFTRRGQVEQRIALIEKNKAFL